MASIRGAESLVYDISSQYTVFNLWIVDGLSSGAMIGALTINSPFILRFHKLDPNHGIYRKAFFTNPGAFPWSMESGSIRPEGLLRDDDLDLYAKDDSLVRSTCGIQAELLEPNSSFVFNSKIRSFLASDDKGFTDMPIKHDFLNLDPQCEALKNLEAIGQATSRR
ncbi:hypothetical protein BDQ12DRAFT_670195 [Crucibulum laeve]|uniref:Uncharacterized protein n=1 Tax=Crucibulum laeve TaxID=68775 RepID=A0A5C3LLR8_9AGAR|nr:hypothetical protein BDQ12DRAFT_670195 [Crucibulum laeve]